LVGVFIMSKEIWLPTKYFSHRYEVSNIGRVRSLDAFVNHKSGGKSFKKGIVLKQFKTPKGYMAVTLACDSVQKTMLVHRVVAESFIDNPYNKPQINHINCIKNDNRVENLEWCTNQENLIHKMENGLCNCVRGESHHLAKLNVEMVEEIRIRLSKGESGKSICKDYNVSNVTIYNIKKGKIWNT